MPSPTWSTVPTSERSVSTSYCSIRCFRIEVISSGRSFTNLSPGFFTCPVLCGMYLHELVSWFLHISGAARFAGGAGLRPAGAPVTSIPCPTRKRGLVGEPWVPPRRSSGRSFTNLSPGFCTSPVRRGLRAEPGFARREPRSHPSHAPPARGVSWGNHGFLHVALRDVASRICLLVSAHLRCGAVCGRSRASPGGSAGHIHLLSNPTTESPSGILLFS